MKRRFLLKLSFLVLAGAIINVAVAWGCAVGFLGLGWLADPSEPRQFEYLELAHRHLDDAQRLKSMDAYRVERLARIGARVDDGMFYTTSSIVFIARLQAGWPAFCFVGELHRDVAQMKPTTRGVFLRRKQSLPWKVRSVAGGVNYTLAAEFNIIPLVPLWPGFAINTIFYAAVFWMLFAAPFKLRRWRRIKRGQCAACGYSLREHTSEKCPECGASK